VVIQVSDPRLLAFIEADVNGGKGGLIGHEGFGGVGGDPGACLIYFQKLHFYNAYDT